MAKKQAPPSASDTMMASVIPLKKAVEVTKPAMIEFPHSMADYEPEYGAIPYPNARLEHDMYRRRGASDYGRNPQSSRQDAARNKHVR